MLHIFDEAEIAVLLSDPKPIKASQRKRLHKRTSSGRRTEVQSIIDVKGASGRRYRIHASEKTAKANGFSIILSYLWHGNWINLIRCNGHHAPHTNTIEKRAKLANGQIAANECHIHRITERYQHAGELPEHFAELAGAYSSISGAIDYLCENFGCYLESNPYRKQYPLFEASP